MVQSIFKGPQGMSLAGNATAAAATSPADCFFNVSRILLFNYTLKTNILETLKKQSLNVPVDCLINVANKQLTVNVL